MFQQNNALIPMASPFKSVNILDWLHILKEIIDKPKEDIGDGCGPFLSHPVLASSQGP